MKTEVTNYGPIIRAMDDRLYSVVSTTDKHVLAFPLGGGFQCQIPKQEIVDANAEPKAKFELAYLGFDDGPICRGFLSGRLWNGWERPLMNREQVTKFMEVYDGSGDGQHVEWRGDDLYYVNDQDGDGNAVIQPKIVERSSEPGSEGKVVHLWDMSLGMTWVHWTDEMIRELQEAERTPLAVGQRVRWVNESERYPHFAVPADTTGVVSEVFAGGGLIDVDQEIEGLSDDPEWNGKFQVDFVLMDDGRDFIILDVLQQ